MGDERPCYALMFLQAKSPFFSNDIEGMLKVAGMILTFSGLVLGGVWKMLSSKLTKDNEKIARDLEGLGQRVNKLAGDCTASNAGTEQALTELRRRADRKDVELVGVTQDVARLEAKVDQSLQQGVDNKVEIIGEFQRAAEIIRTGQHKIELEFATLTGRLEERDRLARERKAS